MIRKHLYLLFLVACASQGQLDGGPVDKQPPIVLSSTPDSAQVMVTGNQIILTFDEYIRQQKTRELLIISPTPQKEPTTSIKNKSFIIQLHDTLIPNTTYSIQLNGCIVDNNESNPQNEYQLFFSTGNYIDSLYYSAVVQDAYSLAYCGDCLIALYSSEKGDSAILKEKPQYVGRTNEKGLAVIPHLSDKSYRAIAFQDKNNNLVLDPEEKVSLYRNALIIDSISADTFLISSYRNIVKRDYKLESPYPGVIHLSSNIPFDGSTRIITQGYESDIRFSKARDSAYINLAIDTGSMLIEIISSDSIVDSLQYSPPKKYKKPKLQAKLLSTGTVEIRSVSYLKNIDSSKVSLLTDSIYHPLNRWSYVEGKYILNFNTPLTNGSYLVIQDSFVTDLNDRPYISDSLPLFYQKSESSNLNLSIDLKDSISCIVILEQNGTMVQLHRIKGSSQIDYNNIAPGKYVIRVIEDRNNNLLWDSGNFLLGIEPETVHLSETIEMRLNWDNSLTIRL